MREFPRIERYVMTMQDLSDITKEVYGISFDIQMGERGQGEYDVVDTREEPEPQGYWSGLEEGLYGPNYDNAKFIDISDKAALAKWSKQRFDDDYHRPFDKLNKKGEYDHYQPEISVVMVDLAERGEIPQGEYQIQIDW